MACFTKQLHLGSLRFSLLLFSVLFGLFSSHAALALRHIESGHWTIVGEDGPGSGVHITQQGRLLAISILTYHEDGQPVWFFAAGDYRIPVVRDLALLSTQNGQPITGDFEPAELIDSGSTLTIYFHGSNAADLVINGVSKPIRYLQFTGNTEQIPGNFSSSAMSEIPDLSGEWMFVDRRFGSPTHTQLMRLTRLDDAAIQADLPDAAIVYADLESPLGPSYVYCFARTFPGLDEAHPTCEIRVVQGNQTQTYTIPTSNITPNRFDIDIVVGNSVLPEIFALRLGD
jgi:hypothetical protein